MRVFLCSKLWGKKGVLVTVPRSTRACTLVRVDEALRQVFFHCRVPGMCIDFIIVVLVRKVAGVGSAWYYNFISNKTW